MRPLHPGWLLAVPLTFLWVGLALIFNNRPRPNPCTANVGNCYSIQGVYSQLKCPGQHIQTVEVNGNSYFLSCYGQR